MPTVSMVNVYVDRLPNFSSVGMPVKMLYISKNDDYMLSSQCDYMTNACLHTDFKNVGDHRYREKFDF